MDPTVTLSLKELNKQTLPRVSLLGAGRSPSVYPIKDGTTVAELLASGGGPTPLADLRQVALTRAGGTEPQSIDLQSLLTRRQPVDPAVNVVLQPGDTIMIAMTDQREYALGRVAKPDAYPLRPDDRLLDALARARGAAVGGDLSKAVLVRRGASGQSVATRLDIRR